MKTLFNQTILLLNNQGLNESGGGVSMIEALVRHFSEKNAVTLISEGDKSSCTTGLFTNIKFMPQRFETRAILWRFAPLLKALALRKSLRHLVADYDIVIALDCRYAFALWKYCRRSLRAYISLSTIPMVAYLDSELTSQQHLVFVQYLLLERRAFHQAQISFVSSKTHLEEVKKYERLRVRPHIIYPFLETRSSCSQDERLREEAKQELGLSGKIVVLTVVRMTRLKNAKYIVDLATQITRDDVVFVVVGDGDHYRIIEQMIEQRGLSNRMRLFGRLENPCQCYQAANIYLHPSKYESFCCTIYEAMLSGLPVVFPKTASGYVSAFEELVEKEDALPLDFGNLNNVKDQLQLLIEKVELRQTMGTQARRKAESFAQDFPSYAEEVDRHIAEIYETTTNRRKERI